MARISPSQPSRPTTHPAKATWAVFNQPSKMVATPPQKRVILNTFQDDDIIGDGTLNYIQHDDLLGLLDGWRFLHMPLRLAA
jgi:hypothetical protein